jgi:poly-gamma-glutamate synthase PgsB/CapB
VEHAENVDLALAVCSSLGIERGLALHGMQLAYPDPGALTLERVSLGAERFTIVNGFAANDPESTALVWRLSLSRAAPGATKIALFNCRVDRADRSQQLGEAVAAFGAADHYVVCGTGTSFFSSSALRAGLDKSRLVVAEGEGAEVLARRLAHLSGSNGFVVGLGNIGGVGLELLDHLRRLRAAPLLSAAPRLPSRLPQRPASSFGEVPSS